MLKIVALVLLIMCLIVCFVVVTQNVFIYILFCAILGGGILFGLIAVAIKLLWMILPRSFRETYEKKRIHLNVVIFFCILFFFFFGTIVRVLLLPDVSKFIGYLWNAARFIFTLFLGWRLMKPRKVKVVAIGSVIFGLFIASLSFSNSTSLRSGEVGGGSSIDNLTSVGYVGWVNAKTNIEETGVTQYDPESAFAGMNLYSSSTSPEAYLIDMQGNVLHKWAKAMKEGNNWRQHVELCENGDLLVIVRDRMLMCLDWNSNLKWKKKMRAHHDIDIYEKHIYAIAREDKLVIWHGIPVPILSDYIVVLSANDRKVIKKIELYDLVQDYFPLRRIMGIYLGILRPMNLMEVLYRKIRFNYACKLGLCFDIMHSNRIEVLDRDVEGFCKKGDWLISIRELDFVGVLDPDQERFVWSWGPGELDSQHYPTLLDNDNVLIFDNGPERGFTRIIELNPVTKKIVWEYKSDPKETFYSRIRGCNQRLPNGNTLITESDKGHVFEVTKDGRIVWEFYNPTVSTKSEKRGAIYHMTRITNPERYNLPFGDN